ncbi:MAG: phosphatase PAP2 family protein [Kofleriaceae bacterium]
MKAVKASWEWLRAKDLRLVALLALIGGLVFAFIKIGRAVSGQETAGFDEAILLALRTTPDDPIGPQSLTNAFMHISALGSGAVTGLIVLISVIFFAVSGHWRYALLMLACSLGTLAGMALLKGFYERDRPTVVTHIDPPGGHSFPSGHSMISAALYITLAVLIARRLETRRQRITVVAIGAALTMLIGFTRLYLGVHYPTDVLAGWTAGLLWALVCGLVVNWFGKRGAKDVPVPADE